MNIKTHNLSQQLSALFPAILSYGLLLIIMLLLSSFDGTNNYITDNMTCENQIISSKTTIRCTYDYLYLIINKDFCVGTIKKDELIKIPDYSDKYYVLESHILMRSGEVGYLIRLTPFDASNKDCNYLQLPDYTIFSSSDEFNINYLRALPTKEQSRLNHIELAKYYEALLRNRLPKKSQCDLYTKEDIANSDDNITNLENGCITLITKDLYPCTELNSFTRGIHSKLIWKNTGMINCIVYASVWSEWDGTYLLKGYSDNNGTVSFDNYILRDASTVSLFLIP